MRRSAGAGEIVTAALTVLAAFSKAGRLSRFCRVISSARDWSRLRAVVMPALVIACLAPEVFAGSGTIISMPSGPQQTVNGLTLSVNTSWAEGRGYRPFQIDVTCTPAAAADRTLNVELSLGVWPTRSYLAVATDVEIPAGSSKVSQVVSVPQYAAMQFLSIDVWEDGLHLDDLSARNASLMSGGVGQWGQPELPCVLFVTRKPLNVSSLGFLPDLRTFLAGAAGDNPAPLTSAAQVATFVERSPAELVENWLNYSSLDIILLSLADARGLASSQPQVWRAIRQWTCAGGNLCVYGVGDDWLALGEIESLVECPSDEDQLGRPQRGWRKPSKESKNKARSADPVNPDDVAAEVAGADDRSDATADDAPFALKQAMLGQVVAIADEDPFPGDTKHWQWMFTAMESWRWNWRQRQGVALDGENPDFDNFFIAEVGLPPVAMYRVLISLFVIAIGPLNYWLLWRYGRLHLLLFTVPAAALVFSAGLIGYVFVADGLTSRLRARSFTEIDQRNHQAVCAARLSYYTGLAPSGGLTFPNDTAIIPLEKYPEWDAFGGQKRQLLWTEQQHLTRGWLGSRTPTQFMTLRAYDSRRELKISGDDLGRQSVRNELGAKIKYLLLCDDAGQLHFAEEIEARGQAQLQPLETDLEKNSALAEVSEELKRHVPTSPPQINALGRPVNMRRAVRGPRSMFRAQAAVAPMTGGLLEAELARVAELVSTGALPPRTYLAIVEHGEDVVVGLDKLTESQSLHVVSGLW
jgi:hypothetical protein